MRKTGENAAKARRERKAKRACYYEVALLAAPGGFGALQVAGRPDTAPTSLAVLTVAMSAEGLVEMSETEQPTVTGLRSYERLVSVWIRPDDSGYAAIVRRA